MMQVELKLKALQRLKNIVYVGHAEDLSIEDLRFLLGAFAFLRFQLNQDEEEVCKDLSRDYERLDVFDNE